MKIETYKTKKLLGRPQWRWRLVVEDVFGEKLTVANGGESYVNKGDMLEEISHIQQRIGDAPIVEVDR